MQVLNTYVKTDTFSGVVLLVCMTLLIIFIINLFKDDITRFLEHHTIGAGFYSYMKHVWKVLIGVVVFVALIIALTAPKNERIFVEATIIDNYPIGAIYDKYEIIEKRGEIWVLEQRPTWQEDVVSESTEKE